MIENVGNGCVVHVESVIARKCAMKIEQKAMDSVQKLRPSQSTAFSI